MFLGPHRRSPSPQTRSPANHAIRRRAADFWVKLLCSLDIQSNLTFAGYSRFPRQDRTADRREQQEIASGASGRNRRLAAPTR
jgi:hypothetical protein